MERARAWIEAGLERSLDPYRLMTYRELIETFPDGISMVAKIVEKADRLQPGWSQGTSGECHIDYVAFRLREACEACLGAEAAGDEMAAERAKYLTAGLAAAKIDGFLHDAMDDAFTESDHLRALQGACRNLRNAVLRASSDPASIGQQVRDVANICQYWRSKVIGAAQYLHRSLHALERLASGNEATAQEIANMAIVEKLMDDYAQTRLADPHRHQGLSTSIRSLCTSSEAVNRGRSKYSARTSADHESRLSSASHPARARVSTTKVRTGNHSSTLKSASSVSTSTASARPS